MTNIWENLEIKKQDYKKLAMCKYKIEGVND